MNFLLGLKEEKEINNCEDSFAAFFQHNTLMNNNFQGFEFENSTISENSEDFIYNSSSSMMRSGPEIFDSFNRFSPDHTEISEKTLEENPINIENFFGFMEKQSEKKFERNNFNSYLIDNNIIHNNNNNNKKNSLTAINFNINYAQASICKSNTINDLIKEKDLDQSPKSTTSTVNTASNLNSIFKVSRGNVFECKEEKCGKTFSRHLLLEKHYRSHKCQNSSTKEITKEFKCNFNGCVKTYKSKENLVLHFKNIHENMKPYSCKFCDSRFSHRNGKLYHEKRFHSSEAAPTASNLCNSYSSSNNIVNKFNKSKNVNNC